MVDRYDIYNPAVRNDAVASYQASIKNGEGIPEGFVPQPNEVKPVIARKGWLERAMDNLADNVKDVTLSAVEKLLNPSEPSSPERAPTR